MQNLLEELTELCARTVQCATDATRARSDDELLKGLDDAHQLGLDIAAFKAQVAREIEQRGLGKAAGRHTAPTTRPGRHRVREEAASPRLRGNPEEIRP